MNKIIVDAGKIIKLNRKAKGYSTQELAKLLDVSPGFINNIENAKNDSFNIELLYKISAVLSIPITDILSYNTDILFNKLNNNLLSVSLNVKLASLFNTLTQVSNNENFSIEKMDMLLNKLIDDINFYCKFSSLEVSDLPQ